MAWIGNYIYDSIFGVTRDEEDQSDETPEFCSWDRYHPSVDDVIAVKGDLHKKSTLPYELIDAIIDMAEYWPHTTTITSQEKSVRAGRNHEDVFLLRSYPLGYLPPNYITRHIENETDINSEPFELLPEDYDMSLKYAKSYSTLQPKPWPESCHIPSEATQIVLSQWTSKSLPKGEYPCRKIVFTIKSHDQGWGGLRDQRGTYVGSYTWFDVGLERMTATGEDMIIDKPELAPVPQFQLNGMDRREVAPESASVIPEPIVCSLRTVIPSTHTAKPDSDSGSFEHALLPSMNVLQKNITASRETTEHQIIWSAGDNVVPDSLDAMELEKRGRGKDTGDGEFVRNLKVGDTVTVWAKARFPQWVNFVEQVRMDIYWAV